MTNNTEMTVKSSKNIVKYEQTPMSFKLTEKTKNMLEYIQNQLQISKSDAIRASISRYYNELKREEGVKNGL